MAERMWRGALGQVELVAEAGNVELDRPWAQPTALLSTKLGSPAANLIGQSFRYRSTASRIGLVIVAMRVLLPLPVTLTGSP